MGVLSCVVFLSHDVADIYRRPRPGPSRRSASEGLWPSVRRCGDGGYDPRGFAMAHITSTQTSPAVARNSVLSRSFRVPDEPSARPPNDWGLACGRNQTIETRQEARSAAVAVTTTAREEVTG